MPSPAPFNLVGSLLHLSIIAKGDGAHPIKKITISPCKSSRPSRNRRPNPGRAFPRALPPRNQAPQPLVACLLSFFHHAHPRRCIFLLPPHTTALSSSSTRAAERPLHPILHHPPSSLRSTLVPPTRHPPRSRPARFPSPSLASCASRRRRHGPIYVVLPFWTRRLVSPSRHPPPSPTRSPGSTAPDLRPAALRYARALIDTFLN